MLVSPVNSTAIRLIGYDAQTETLRIAFRRGDIYDYQFVPETVFNTLRSAESVGKSYQSLKGNYPCSRLSEAAAQTFLEAFEQAYQEILIEVAT